MIRLLITNAYDARNRGDAAIVRGMIESFSRTVTLGGAAVSVSSAGYPTDCSSYEVPVTPSFFSLQRSLPGGRRLGRAYFLGLLLPLSSLWAFVRRLTRVELPVPPGLGRVLQEYARADLIVAAGGGYLYTTSRLKGNVVLMMHVFSFLFGALLGKPVYLYAQSIGPFAGRFQAWLVRAALGRVQLVEAREAWTRELLAGWGLRVRVTEAADAAFLLPVRTDGPHGLPPRDAELRVGVTVRGWFRDPGRQRRYEGTMAAFLDRVVSDHDAEVVFLPQVTVAEQGDDDRVAARRVRALMSRHDRATVVENELDVAAVRQLCGQVDCLVGTRMHSNVFAVSLGVPVIALAYQPKTLGIMEQLGLAEFVVDIEDLSADALMEVFRRLRRDDARVRQRLGRILPGVVSSAERAGRVIAEDFLALCERAATGPGGPR